MAAKTTIRIPSPVLQIGFSQSLKTLRQEILHEALANAVQEIPLKELNEELSAFAEENSLKRLAAAGLRGELLFVAPCLLRQAPKLLGYYRLLLGFSQKEFYGSGFGTARFKSSENQGTMSLGQSAHLETLCKALNQSACSLLDALDESDLTARFLQELALLTLGPQLRGGANVRKGTAGIQTVFEIIHRIVSVALVAETRGRLHVRNAAGRDVQISFAPDPDIVITEAHDERSFRNIVAIEVKAGTDFSNIHNRIGEAEKSHQKARANGFVECWTIVNIDKIDLNMARSESPSTHRFFRISALLDKDSEEFSDFRYRILSLVGLPSA